MNGIIDTGGGLRGAFGAGVLDWCCKNDIHFDYCLGVSAGAGNLVSYLAGQVGRNLRFYVDYAGRPEYMSLRNAPHKKGYFDVDYIYSGLTNEDGEDPLDYDAMMANPAAFKVVATDADSGLPVYFDKSDFQRNDYFPLKASSNVPLLDKAYEHDGRSYFDGGLSDPIPLARAQRDGCDKVVVLLSRSRDFIRRARRDAPYARLLRLHWPKAANALKYRYKTYNLQRADLLEAEREGRALIIAPENTEGIGLLTRDPDVLQRLYYEGYIAAEQIAGFLGSTARGTAASPAQGE
ncbi:MAG: patatin-like phospholipase family protein [Anaerovoracaceae bacterium]|jgi:predicted patatin/cPLA2 family phospholipase